MKKRALVPTLLTLGNAVCGLAAIAYASRIGKVDSTPEMDRAFLAASGWLICAAMLFDTLDGFFARLFKAAGRFGAELDSLCDAISFGAAPAFILLQLGPGRDQPFLHKVLASIATLYMMCTILRLARFNVESIDGGSKKFKGLPSPAAAGCIASLAIVRGTAELRWPGLDPVIVESVLEIWSTVGAFIVAVLMVSNVAYPHLTKQMLRGKRRQPAAIIPLALVAGIVLREFALVVIFWAYAVSFFAQALIERLAHRSSDLDGELDRRF
ncbi:MAG: CDP-diacylglycerol--serine O-phosphatidyltransferase [Gemmataceae bacterium]|nr:CDP-diacylglycerol--serine O-phosphatidyltransferase [Gemmataceae bacterium]